MGPGAAGGREISSELAKRPRGRDARGQGHPCHAPVRRPGEDRQKGRRPGGAIRLGGRPRALGDVEGRDTGCQGAGHEAPRARHRGHVRPRRERGPEPRHADDRVRDLHGPLRHPVRGVHRRRADARARGGAGSGARLRAPAPGAPEGQPRHRRQAPWLHGPPPGRDRGHLRSSDAAVRRLGVDVEAHVREPRGVRSTARSFGQRRLSQVESARRPRCSVGCIQDVQAR
mmetsp:Transcript_36655/g.82430  ORF Transcript_36655/g.82430 Transcript_36655/m.82430 type:complete len:229 (+) Transcript_36655:516-1202(+)